MSFLRRVKNNLPATFNTAEYEAVRILERLDMLEKRFHSENANLMTKTLEHCESIQNEQADKTELILRRLDELERRISLETGRTVNELSAGLNRLREYAETSNLFAAADCKSDLQFNQKLSPINRFYSDKGVAMSMFLTSVDKKHHDMIYQYADIGRYAALELLADEIYERNIAGEVAELGVSRGDFASIMNVVFPDRKLYLFDTFDGFDECDMSFDWKNGFSEAKKENYAGISVDEVLFRMEHRENCIIKKGYFPDTAEGLEETFCFVNIDCDLFQPVYAGLRWFYPRVIKGGYIFVHDYRSKYYRGAKEALRKFSEENRLSYAVLPDNTGTAVIVK